VLSVGGAVNQVNVNVGDVVTTGQVLMAIDATGLERALRRAQLNFDASQNSLAQLQEAGDPNEVAQAEAQLAAAQENLKDVQAGPSDEEIAAANASLASAWALYEERTAPMSDAERTTLEASLKTAEVALAEAQRNYDAVAWRNEVGMTAEAAALQEASIEYERLRAEYEIAAEPASQSDVQSALSSARDAQQQLDDLLAQPTAAELATAEAEVASAQATLESVKRGATDLELQAAEIALEQTLVDLEEAYTQLQQATVVAPINGTVMQVTGEVGQQLGAGEVVVILADTSQLELPVAVAEVDIDQVTIGQPAEITIDALLGRTYQGEVARIAPASESTDGVVSYEIVIRLIGDDLAGVRPDMTAVASLANTEASTGWLVPSTALSDEGGETVVTVVRDDQPTQVAVAPGGVQGEWTVVQSADLRTGDQVVGSVASYVDQDSNFGFRAGEGGPGGN
jgi:HlyD family secretion protein